MASQLDKDNELLEEMVRTGKCDISEWPALCQRICDRLEDISINIFQVPASSLQNNSPPSSPDPTIRSSEPNNHPVSPPATNSPSPHPHTPSTPLADIQETLRSNFARAPPHTIQRFAELILNPTSHTKIYEKYLRALSRVLSVTSTVEAFPLPINELETTSVFPVSAEESLGGARLTPIPWLEKSELTDGVLGDSATTKEELANGVSQGELLRREQVLDIVPQTREVEEGAVHEGPSELTAEDVGPQPEGTVFKDANGEMKEDEEMKDEEMKDAETEGPREGGAEKKDEEKKEDVKKEEGTKMDTTE